IMDYSLKLIDDGLDEKSVRNEIFLLKGFCDFLDRRRLVYQDITDSLLKSFRSEELSLVKTAKNSSRAERTAMRTVNAKLRRTYKFLYWLQHSHRSVLNLIGPRNCPVKSNYLPPNEGGKNRRNGRYESGRKTGEFPVLFDHAGEGNRPTQYEATDEDVELIAEMFLSELSPHAAQRNILMMDLGCEVSWRRGAINSMTCDQFSRLDFSEANHDSYIVIPPSQKFGYQREFEVPFRLAFRIAEFIANERKDFLASRGWSEARTLGRIFISERSGLPLKDQSISAIFGAAFNALGRPRGANTHSFRRKFANEEIDDEILNRLEMGLDTNEVSIATTVAFKMGQSNPESLEPYVNKSLDRMVKRHKKLKENRIQALEDENRELKARIALLEKSKGSSK
ncbi:hypothetical protein, partial [Herbaspirillum chlorophenolicum]